MGNFDEFIPGGKPTGNFDEFMPDKKPHFQNILQNAAKSIGAAAQAGMQNASPLGVKVNPSFPFLPQMPTDSPALQAGMDEAQMPITKGNPFAQAGMGLASNLLAGGILGGKQAVKGVGETVGDLRQPSKAFGRKIGSMQKSEPGKRVDFLNIISEGMNDPKASKVIEKSGVMGKYGGSSLGEGGSVSENLSNLSLKDSQDLINSLKDGVRQAVKEGVVKPTEIGISKMFGELAKAQQVFSGMKVARGAYGFAKKSGKAASSLKKNFVRGASYGAGLGAGGTAIAYPFLKNK